ncbi:MAG: SRPBCC family protein [Deferribacteres bacterium]|nr:SRPBCC family protein [candidate division KSB1 bacterium]MCB9508849.1 SRPBCC family protein [Deferribacteres bacterium]
MKVLKGILIFIGAIVVLYFVVALFLPTSYELDRSIIINKSPDVVFGQVSDFNNWMGWNPWTKMEPTAKSTISGQPGTVGHSWEWDGKQIGSGKLTFAAITPPQSIHSKMVFYRPMEGTATDDWTFESTEGGTKVTWTSAGELPYGAARYMGLMMDSMLGTQMEQGLSDLKGICESLPEMDTQNEKMEEETSGSN